MVAAFFFILIVVLCLFWRSKYTDRPMRLATTLRALLFICELIETLLCFGVVV
jgi:hypothetical protein